MEFSPQPPLSSDPSAQPGVPSSLLDDARSLQEELRRFRRDLHRHPEVGLDLPRTQEAVLGALEGLGLEVSRGREVSSVTAVLRGGRRRERDGDGVPTVLLRADMDALPVEERSGAEYSSEEPGAMHACGHDLHTAMLVGAARLLAARRDELEGDVLFMFQPGEEGCDGAGHMLREGVLEASGRRPDAAFGLHVMSLPGPRGRIRHRGGVLMGGSSALRATLLGRGGHGSSPHLAKDPVPALGEIITGLQSVVTRTVDILDPAVLSVGVVEAGGAKNVIAESARFEATIRAFSEDSVAVLERALPAYVRGVAQAHGLEADVEFEREYPVTVTDPAEDANAARLVEAMFAQAGEAGRLEELPRPISASEDFSRVLAEVPGTYMFLSAAADPETVQRPDAFNHSPFAVFDDGVLADGAAAHACFALGRLGQLARGEAE